MASSSRASGLSRASCVRYCATRASFGKCGGCGVHGNKVRDRLVTAGPRQRSGHRARGPNPPAPLCVANQCLLHCPASCPEIDLTDAASLLEGALKSFPTPNEGPEVLLVRHAAWCTPLPRTARTTGLSAKGQLVNGKIVRPWHHACFRVADGTLCEPPALDNLPAFAVREADGRVLASSRSPPPAPTTPAPRPRRKWAARCPPMPPGPRPMRVHLRAGGRRGSRPVRGPNVAPRGICGEIRAGVGRRESALRPHQAQQAVPGGQGPARRRCPARAGFCEKHRIDLQLNTRATGLDLAWQEVQLAGRPLLRYDQLLLASAGPPTACSSLPGHTWLALPLRTQPTPTPSWPPKTRNRWSSLAPALHRHGSRQ
ncbi:MAG: hypothetical protein WKG07_08965 [Hymenobacter sp.]